MNGYDTTILEANNRPGGLCTSWKRMGYTIDVGIYGMLGTTPEHPLFEIWNELIDMNRLKFQCPSALTVYELAPGKRLTLYCDPERLQHSMETIAPEDRSVIRDFVKGIRALRNLEMPVRKPKEFYNFLDYLRMGRALPALSVVRKWLKVSPLDFADQFQNPFLREALRHMSSPVLNDMYVMSAAGLGAFGYPLCGSFGLASLIERKYRELGGYTRYNSPVSRVIVQNDSAQGVELTGGETLTADLVVSTADGNSTIYGLLDGQYVDQKLEDLYQTLPISPSRILVSIGIGRKMDEMPPRMTIVLSRPLRISDGRSYGSIEVRVMDHVSEAAPSGKSLLLVGMESTTHDYWAELRDRNWLFYQREKDRIALAIIDILEERIGDIKDNIEMIDVATPSTFFRQTRNWKGSTHGWSQEQMFQANPLGKELPRLRNFYMAGQWVEPGGGLHSAVKSGRDVAQIISRRDRKRSGLRSALANRLLNRH